MPNSSRLLQIYVATEAMPECEMCAKEFLPKSRQLTMLRIQMFLFSAIKIAKVCIVALLHTGVKRWHTCQQEQRNITVINKNLIVIKPKNVCSV